MTDYLALIVAAAAEAAETDAQRRARQVVEARRYYVTRRCSIPTAAETMGVTVEYLAGLLAEGGVQLRIQRPRRPGIRREIPDEAAFAAQIAAEYASGVSLTALSTRYNIGKDRTRHFIRKGGAEIRPVGTQAQEISAEERAEIVRLYRDEHWSYRRIQTHLGCSGYRVMQALDLNETAASEWRIRRKDGQAPDRAEIERLIGRYTGELVPLTKLARQEGWDWRRLKQLFVVEGVRIRGPGPVRKRPR